MNLNYIKKTILICILCLLNTAALQAQEEMHPRQYEYGKPKIIFEDEMNDDRNGWLASFDTSLKAHATLDNGHLTIQNNDTEYATCLKLLPINQEKDFEIEFGYKIIKSGDKHNEAVHVCWGLDTISETKEMLSIAPNGCIRVSHCVGGNHKGCDQDRGIDLVPKKLKNQFTVIRIRRVNAKYYFFANGKLCERARFYKLNGNMIALSVEGDATVEYDYISISYLV